MPVNIEIKAKTTQPAFIREWLIRHKAESRGTDIQTDTYFNVSRGRLKLRQGNIEKNLIWYLRPNEAGPKRSYFYLAGVDTSPGMLELLTAALGVWVTVQKKREIYYIGNVKFHLDEVAGLGSFVEIEAGNGVSDLPVETLRMQCEHYMEAFGIVADDLMNCSYSDLLLALLPKNDRT